MRHDIMIWSKSQNGFIKIETHISVSEEEIEQLALKKYKDEGIRREEGKSLWAELNETIHN